VHVVLYGAVLEITLQYHPPSRPGPGPPTLEHARVGHLESFFGPWTHTCTAPALPNVSSPAVLRDAITKWLRDWQKQQLPYVH
jgi:hypothetical protein